MASVKLDQQFILFAKVGDTKLDGTSIALTQVDTWFKQANIFNKKFTRTDTGMAFNLAEEKNMELENLKLKLYDCGPPGMKKKEESSNAEATS